MNPGGLLRAMFDAAVAAAQPARIVPRWLSDLPPGPLVVLGAGKAAAAMAQAVEENWHGPLGGLVVTRYGHAVPCDRIEVIEAGHPVPDAAGVAGAERMMAVARSLGEGDVALCLLSGGGSALLPLPRPGITLADKQAIGAGLLASGATIGEINLVRRHLSAIKGGRLAAACHPAAVVSLLISDVPGDDPVDIASGPTVPDPTLPGDALAVLRRYAIDAPEHIVRILASGDDDTIKPGDPRIRGSRAHIVAAPQQSLEAAAQVAARAGIAAHILGDAIEGEAREVGKVMAGLARQVARRGQPFAAPCVLLSGGETSVTVRGDGRGGRNVEFLLSLALELRGESGVYALAADTDGIDGMEAVAGAVITPDTLDRAARMRIGAAEVLARQDCHSLFARLRNQVVTGPTLTNVNDFRAILIVPAGADPCPAGSDR